MRSELFSCRLFIDAFVSWFKLEVTCANTFEMSGYRLQTLVTTLHVIATESLAILTGLLIVLYTQLVKEYFN